MVDAEAVGVLEEEDVVALEQEEAGEEALVVVRQVEVEGEVVSVEVVGALEGVVVVEAVAAGIENKSMARGLVLLRYCRNVAYL